PRRPPRRPHPQRPPTLLPVLADHRRRPTRPRLHPPPRRPHPPRRPQERRRMTRRHTVDTITSDALDALYDQLEAAEAGEAQRQLATARKAMASATTRAARAETALDRARET